MLTIYCVIKTKPTDCSYKLKNTNVDISKVIKIGNTELGRVARQYVKCFLCITSLDCLVVLLGKQCYYSPSLDDKAEI